MIEHGIIKIRRKIEQDVLLEGIENLSKELGEEYKYNSASYITEDGYAVIDFRRVYLGKKLCIAICKNSKGRISLLAVLKRNVNEELLDKLISGLTEITGGKFHGSV